MARLAEWSVLEPSGKQHRLSVDRKLLGGVGVTFDRRPLPRFDRPPDGDRYVLSVAGNLLTVVVPRSSGDQPALSVDGRPVYGTEAILTQREPAAGDAAAAGAPVSGEDFARYQLQQQRNGGASWFYWIGGASVLNSVLYAAQVEWGLVVGLGITYFIDGVAAELSGTVRTPIYAFVIDVAIASGVILIGRAARHGRLGWYVFGMAFYVLDGLLFVLVQDLLGIAVHAIALFGLLSGWRAGRALKKLEGAGPALAQGPAAGSP
jgi:hypothetical protein